MSELNYKGVEKKIRYSDVSASKMRIVTDHYKKQIENKDSEQEGLINLVNLTKRIVDDKLSEKHLLSILNTLFDKGSYHHRLVVCAVWYSMFESKKILKTKLNEKYKHINPVIPSVFEHIFSLFDTTANQSIDEPAIEAFAQQLTLRSAIYAYFDFCSYQDALELVERFRSPLAKENILSLIQTKL